MHFENMCNLCRNITETSVKADDKSMLALKEIFGICISDIDICQSCLQSLSSFHKFFLMVRHNLSKADFSIKPESVDVEVPIKLEEIHVVSHVETRDTPIVKEEDSELQVPTLDVSVKVEESEKVSNTTPTGKRRGRRPKTQTLENTGRSKKASSERPRPTLRKNKREIRQPWPPNALFVCDLCSKRFTKHESVKKHIENVHLKICRYICNICGIGLYNSRKLTHHLVYVHQKKEDQQPCKLCGRVVKNLKQHMYANHNGNRVCSVCGQSFANHKSYYDHVRRRHKQDQTLHECKECGKGFKKKFLLKEHSYTHAGGFLHSCEFCSYQTNYKRNLRTHMKKQHTEDWMKERDSYLATIYDINNLPKDSRNPAVMSFLNEKNK